MIYVSTLYFVPVLKLLKHCMNWKYVNFLEASKMSPIKKSPFLLLPHAHLDLKLSSEICKKIVKQVSKIWELFYPHSPLVYKSMQPPLQSLSAA